MSFLVKTVSYSRHCAEASDVQLASKMQILLQLILFVIPCSESFGRISGMANQQTQQFLDTVFQDELINFHGVFVHSNGGQFPRTRLVFKQQDVLKA